MASLPESRIPGPAAGGGGKDKRRSFLPAPKRSSGIPTPGTQPPPPPSAAQASPAEDPVQVLKPPKVAKQEIAREEPKEVVPGAAQLVVGKRVLISGVKPGILRYVGKTHIAPGYWCGVELFDASGLHDGEVDGTRYFSCKSFRGIFAPLDKVVVDESAEVSDSKSETRIQKPSNADSGQAPKLEEKREIDNEAGRNDIQKKSLEEESAASKLPVPGKSQIARLSGIPRVGAGGGVVKSTSVETFTKTEKDAPGHKRTGSSSEHDLNATLTVDRSGTGRVRTVSEDSDADGSLNRTYSCTVEKQLQSDSRRYFNITFNKDTPPKSAGGNGTGNNLPDVVSSASPSPTPPSWDGAGRTVPSVLNQTQSAQDSALALASDMSLGLMEPDIIADETNLLDGLAVDRVTSSASESDISQSNSSTLDEASVATVAEAGVGMTSTPLQGEGFRKFLEDKGGTLSGSLREADAARSFEEGSTSDVKRNLGPAFSGSPHHQGDPAQRKDSSSSSSNSAAADYSFPQKQELLQEEGSNGISPEVSQVLEWDYDHDAFDGKLLEKSAESMSTSTSDSCSEASADHGPLTDKGIGDGEAPAGEMDNQFEDTEDGFENIDDFPLGMSREAKHMMTDSGISEKSFGDPTSDPKRRSVEFDSKISVMVPPEGVVLGSRTEGELTVANVLQQDLADGNSKKERPLSLLSTTSVDTGYVPDTDSEAGTLTTNSPTEWAEKQLSGQSYAAHDAKHKASTAVRARQASSGGSGGVLREVETDSDVYSEACTTLHDTETEGPSDVDEVEQTEQTATGLETEDSEDDDDEDEDEEVTDSDNDELVDDLPEDDRVEADRSAPSAGGSRTTTAASGRAGVASQPGEAQRSALRVVDEMTESASRLGSEMTESATPGMTENAEPPSSRPDGSADAEAREASANRGDNAGEGTSTEPAAAGEESTVGQVSGESANAGIGEGTQASTPSQKKGKQASAAGGSKKTVVEHKKVNVKATSRLADYINAPLPTKPKEEKKAETKAKKNNAGNTSKANRGAGKNADNSSSNTPDKAKGDEGSGNMEEKEKEKKPTPVKEAKPKVKRLAPKSKWGDIMSQIEANKDTTKVKPKSEIKSSLAVYLSTPATPANTNTNANANNPSNTSNNNTTPSAKKDSNKKEEMSKPRSKLVNHPKPDFSNIKSKLNLSIPATPSPNRRDSSSGPAPAANPGTPKNTSAKKPVASKTKQGRMQMGDGRLDTPDTWSVVSQPASSTTDLSVFDVTDTATPSPALPDGQPTRNSASRVAPRLKNERPSSVASSRSDHSTPRSVKTMNLKNAQKSDATNTSQSRRSSVKSSIPPPTPKRAENKASTSRKPPVPSAKSAAMTVTPRNSDTKTAPPSAGRAAASKPSSVGNNQSRSRVKSGGQLKSGHPPDVVSTSARGTRAQEVARLESLCETRTKELNYTKMQLKAGLQAFDAMACLLNYCTNQLDAFSCPEVTAKLKVAEGNLSEQQKQIECLEQQKANVEQQLAEVTQARDAALQDVGKLQQEMKAAEEAHQTAVQQLKDDQEAALKSQEDVLHTHHQQKNQQLQRYHEKQMEYALQAHKRQLAEVTAEHNMDTNQLKVAHLEEIQELRNKHDKQMEELHAQHRNKLEDITRRFESIKLSLSEKVESLCKECEDLRIRAKASEDALQRDADVKVQLALTPYLHLPKEIESLKTVVDMRTEEIQKLRRQNMDLEKQLEELPIAQEKVASLQQKVENLQAIINIKTDHEKQLHEKCQVLMRKYDRESRANKRLSMDYEQVMWRMSQSADSAELLAQTLSHSPTRGGIEPLVHGSPSPVRRSMSNNAQGDGPGVTRRQRRVSGGDEDLDRKIRCRSATFVMDKSKAVPRAEPGVNGTGSAPDSVSGSPSKQIMSRSADYTAEIVAALNNDPDDLWSSGQFSDLQSSLEDSVILHTSKDFFETPQGVSYSVMVQPNGTAVAQDKVFEESDGGQTAIADESWVASSKANVTVVVNSPVAE